MSYSGYEDHICEVGHLYSSDAFADGETCHCGKKSVFCNSVDQTNCEEYGTIVNWQKFMIADAKVETCVTCNHTTIVEETRYRAPTKEELKEVRSYWDAKKEQWVLVKDYP